ncbi:nucleoside diphosphate kinase homolog 7 isoform X1 [Amia ocellicauda]|uniref:nucleoside diphosphate kinase homolog 7 isoform X1 n=1 Tax=Amia ocellicauda TaxID=2972642 RepID=UPI00346470F4
MSQEDRYAFLAEWYDPNAALLRRYQLLFYPKDGSVEMFDVKNQRTFLRRTKYDELRLEDLFVGNHVNVFSRQLHLIGYGDQYTASKLGSKKERTLAMIKPDAVLKMGDIIQIIYDAGLTITKAKMTKLSWKEAMDFYAEHQSKSFFNNLLQFVTSGPVVALELMGDEAVSGWRGLLGPTDSNVARSEAAASVRARFGTDGTKNAGHGSDSLASAARELEFFFPSTTGRGPSNTAKYTDCTCCIIKPHAISEALTGKILNAISEAGFQVSALQMVNMDRANAEEFFEVYKGVVAEYTSMVAELCSGPCMALEICATEAPRTFREFCGPADPEIARHLRPNTLRALFGKNKIQNAVHCTDLPEDGILEVQYFFKILDG